MIVFNFDIDYNICTIQKNINQWKISLIKFLKSFLNLRHVFIIEEMSKQQQQR